MSKHHFYLFVKSGLDQLSFAQREKAWLQSEWPSGQRAYLSN